MSYDGLCLFIQRGQFILKPATLGKNPLIFSTISVASPWIEQLLKNCFILSVSDLDWISWLLLWEDSMLKF
jgi:hypothetical protein